MPSVEIIWPTRADDTASVTVHAPCDAWPGQLRLMICGATALRIPPAEARLLAQALLDMASEPATAPPVGLYHEPEEEITNG